MLLTEITCSVGENNESMCGYVSDFRTYLFPEKPNRS